MGVNESNRVSCLDYLHERAEESRHNEILAYLMFVAGAIFFVGGLVTTAITTENPQWFLFFPYEISPDAYSYLDLFMVLSGFMLLILGMVLCIYYTFDKAFYLDQLNEVSVNKKNKEMKTGAVDKRTKAFAKQFERTHRELRECKKYLMNYQGLLEDDSIYYCRLLGDKWRELVEEEELYAHRSRRI